MEQLSLSLPQVLERVGKDAGLYMIVIDHS